MRIQLLVSAALSCIACGSGGGGGGGVGDGDADTDVDTDADADGDTDGTVPNGTCEDGACGGDPVGVWDLVMFCGPDYVTSVAQTLHFDADGTYSYQSAYGGSYSGTWSAAGTTLTITVGDDSSHADYCVGGDLFWWSEGGLSIVRERAGTGGDGR